MQMWICSRAGWTVKLIQAIERLAKCRQLRRRQHHSARVRVWRRVSRGFCDRRVAGASQFLRVNLVDSNVHVDVIGVMADDAHSLVFSVAQLAVEPLLDES